MSIVPLGCYGKLRDPHDDLVASVLNTSDLSVASNMLIPTRCPRSGEPPRLSSRLTADAIRASEMIIKRPPTGVVWEANLVIQHSLDQSADKAMSG
jgi:hypothetical protein